LKKIFAIIFLLLVSCSFATPIQENDFLPSENGTLPSNIDARYDGGVDVIVTAYSNVSGVTSDAPNGDGYVLRLGDLGSGGGFYNWAAVKDMSKATTDSYTEAYVYLNLSVATVERDFGLFVRCTSLAAQGTGSSRNGYMLLITANSLWSSYTAVNYTPFILKRNGSTGWTLVAAGTSTVSDGWHKLKIQAIGTTISGFVDDVKVAEGTDSTFTSGVGGMVYYDDTDGVVADTWPYAAAFDQFKFGTASPVNDWKEMK